MQENTAGPTEMVQSLQEMFPAEDWIDNHILDLLPIAVYVCDMSGIIKKYNEQAAKLWGSRPDAGTYLPLHDTPAMACLKDGLPRENIEIIIERPDHSCIWVRTNIVALRDKKGDQVGMVNYFYDITGEKEGLQESELRYRELVQTLQTPLYTTDAEGRITLFNKAAADLWGRQPEIGKDLWCGSFKILNTDGSPLPLDSCPMAVCLKEQRAVYDEEILVIRPDGSLRHVVPHPQPIFDGSGKMTGAINMLVDITAIKNVENALRDSETKYRNLAVSLEERVVEKTQHLTNRTGELKKSEDRYHKMVEEVEDYAIILLDSDGIIRDWNKGAEKIKGYKEEEIIGQSFQCFYLPEDRKRGLPLQLLKEATDNGKAIHEGWRLRKNGDTFWGSIVLTALHDDQNRIIGFSKVTRDLTERKLAEDQMKEYLSQLEFQNKELEQFNYAASHDMKEPLRKIHLYNGFIAENPANQLDERSREYLTRSIQAVTRMKTLIEDLLSYSRVTTSTQSYEEVDLRQIIEDITLTYNGELEEKRVSIQSENLGTIWGIPFQIKQLMSNLIDNSIKYRLPDKHVVIKISCEIVDGNGTMGYKAEPANPYHKISVEDNGIGFDDQYSQRIFEIFQRLNNLPGAKGSGIGLAICKKIVQNHKGFLRATGKVNEGASFQIFIPKTS